MADFLCRRPGGGSSSPEGGFAVSAQDSSWTYRFQGSRGGIRALSSQAGPEQTAPGSLEYRHAEGIVERYLVQSRGVEQQFVLPGPYAGGTSF